MRTEILSIVFTDIKGYTAATSTQSHRENEHMLRRIDRIIAPVVRGYSGRVVKSIGDAYMIVFRSPTEAVRCATAVQDRLHQYNASARADQAIHIRIAMNIGEVRVHRGDVFGEPVNIASRIESITPADEIYFSEAIYLTMNRSQLYSERVGDFELKGIPEPITVYRARAFAHVETNDTPETDTQVSVTGLPFGGTELGHWRRMRWVRRAYMAMWALVIAGVAGASYLRYRPGADYSAVLARMQSAIEKGLPKQALAAAVDIPISTTEEYMQSRRLRRKAIALLIEKGNTAFVAKELDALIKSDSRDAEALLLRSAYLIGGNKDIAGAADDIANALKLNPALANRVEVSQYIAHTYRDPMARRVAEYVVENYLKQNAVPSLTKALSDKNYDIKTRMIIASRLEKLGAGQDIDWVTLALEQLKSTNCKSRLDAISRLVSEYDERAIKPLRRIAGSKGCGALQARRAVESILGK
ncbi:MAG: adenylate/guanylate cyclase domain-containing protein [Deltaproteobacteria bacterium]|nr:adenylate/guanylate cyclase domain-containing protein [Deltaproteobacteria bacterium]